MSAQINARFADEETELSDSLSRSGKGGMLSSLRTPDGTVAAPAVSFTSEPGSGVYRAGAGDVRIAVGGVDFVTTTTIAFPASVAGLVTVKTSAANAGMVVQGNKNAADTGTEVLLVSSAARTAGTLLSVQNPLNTPKLNVDYQGLLQLQNTAAIQPASIWTAITPNAGWTASSVLGLSFFKDALGIVHLRGAVSQGGGLATVAFTLPAGYRPAAATSRTFVVTTPAGARNAVVDAAGGVGFADTTAGTYYVDPISFIAEA